MIRRNVSLPELGLIAGARDQTQFRKAYVSANHDSLLSILNCPTELYAWNTSQRMYFLPFTNRAACASISDSPKGAAHARERNPRTRSAPTRLEKAQICAPSAPRALRQRSPAHMDAEIAHEPENRPRSARGWKRKRKENSMQVQDIMTQNPASTSGGHDSST